ncbi:MAG TPA: hypothetical protein DHW02_20995 [Ktedonobacter sp.]|nr:hypothetical protein [Ktedonobacter sp.]
MKFLIIDDSPYDRALVIRRLQKDFTDATYVEAARRDDLNNVLQQSGFDIALIDYRLQWTNGITLLKTLKERFPDLPVVMVTDTGSEEIAAEGMKSGLSDYVLKRDMHRLTLAVTESIEKAHLRAEREILESQVRQAQKMESLGQLVSGIAHDFNNMLGGILGYTDQCLIKIQHDKSHPLYHDLSHARDITLRAAKTTRQLLAFSRRQVLESTDININDVVADLLSLIGKLLADFVEIDFTPEPTLHTVHADATQLGQVLMNLCLNARDAMPGGGKLYIVTRNISLSEPLHRKHTSIPAGEYALLQVQDTGTGMDTATLDKIFDPFFTTKELGRGTGLGLSVVHGIVGQHEGFIDVESTLDVGTTFSIYLPIVNRIATKQETKQTQSIEHGHETVLLVEDDPDLRYLMGEVLTDYGYTIISASDGVEGLRLFHQHDTQIALIISDMMTPQMSGRELREHVLQSNPDTRFLFMSGYSADQFRADFVPGKDMHFLQKPFDLDELAKHVRELIE